MDQKTVIRRDIVRGLQSLGLSNGMSVIVHSSLSSLGYVEGGAETLIEALLETVGAEGHVMMPTFTNMVPRFDPLIEASQTGRVTDVFWRRPDVIRSWHPSHSVAVFGPKTTELVAGHEMMAGLGIDSPMDKVAQMGGYVLLLGTDLRTCSLIHTGEVRAYVPFLGEPSYEGALTEADVHIPSHCWLRVRFSITHGCSLGFHKLEPHLRSKKGIREGQVGQAKALLIRGQVVIETTVSLLEKKPGALLCDRSICYFCDVARRILNEKEGSTQANPMDRSR